MEGPIGGGNVRPFGGPETIRTSDLLLRRESLYPAELRDPDPYSGTPSPSASSLIPVHNGSVDLFDAHLHFRAPEPAPGWDGVCCGTHPSQWPKVLAWAATVPAIRPSLGMHPWWLAKAPKDWPQRLEEILGKSRAAVGECGLDEAMREFDPTEQDAALRIHIRLARNLERPLVLHLVRAWGRLERVLNEEPLPERIMIHAFSGSPESVRALNRRGIYLSFGPMGHDSPRIQAALQAADPALLLLETDASDTEGQAAFPAWVEAAAAWRGEASEVLAARCAENARRCFEGVRA